MLMELAGTVLIEEICDMNAGSTETRLGGGALYGIAGARVWLPSSKRRSYFQRGRDLSISLAEELTSLAGNETWAADDVAACIHARITYRGTNRAFEYIVPPQEMTAEFLSARPGLTGDIFHLVATPINLEALISTADSKAFIIVEPFPFHCNPTSWQSFLPLLSSIDILSPNHLELSQMLRIPLPVQASTSEYKLAIEALVDKALKDAKPRTAVVLRCAELGVCAKGVDTGVIWVPAYFEDATAVIDTTGGQLRETLPDSS